MVAKRHHLPASPVRWQGSYIFSDFHFLSIFFVVCHYYSRLNSTAIFSPGQILRNKIRVPAFVLYKRRFHLYFFFFYKTLLSAAQGKNDTELHTEVYNFSQIFPTLIDTEFCNLSLLFFARVFSVRSCCRISVS